MFIQGILLVLFYFIVFVLPIIGLIFGIIGIKEFCKKNRNKKQKRYCIYGILSIIFILLIIFFPIHTITSYKYSKPDSILKYFENNFYKFEDCSFGFDTFPQNIWSCRLGEERIRGEKYNGIMIIELEYRKGTLFNSVPNTKFNNIIVYSEDDIINNNPRPELFKEIKKTNHENWYFIYVTENYVYF